jgi:hypothetical protein
MDRDSHIEGFLFWLTGALVLALLAGCSSLGPSAISNGRLAYNEAIVATENQQMLMLAIHSRYGERGNLLAVSSVTANVSVTTRASVEVGAGDAENFAGNLVPFGAGVIYEENPTISYMPVGGEKYMRRLFSPIPIVVVAELLSRMTNPKPIYTAIIWSVNGIYNPDFLAPGMEPDPRFARFVTLMDTLTQAHRLHWIESEQPGAAFSIAIDRYSAGYESEISELLSLLGLPAAAGDSEPVVIPVALALHGRKTDGIGISTRSVWELVEVLSASVEVPEEDRENNVAETYPPLGPIGQDVRVRVADTKPDHAYVAVEYRGHWFYIDERDQATKAFFRIVAGLLGVTIAETTAPGRAAPVLTVPVN